MRIAAGVSRPGPVRRAAAARTVADRGAWPILTLLAVVGGLGALIAVTGRGAFIDEGIYLVAGRTLAFRGENWGYDLWFNGSPFAFPLLAGVVQRFGGGLVAVRLVNVGFLLIAVWSVYKMGSALRLAWPAPVLGAAAFGLAGPVLFTGSFATYDVSAVAATSVALWLVLLGTPDERVRPWLLVGAGLALAGAVILKYVVIAITPAFLALVLARLAPIDRPYLRPRRWRPALTGAALATIPAALVIGLYVLAFWSSLQVLIAFRGFHLTNYGATSLAIVWAVLLYVGSAWLVACIGLERLHGDRRAVVVGLVLVGGSLIMPLYHILLADPLALFKQVSWSLLLLAPLNGLALASLLPRRRLFVAVSVALLAVSLYHVLTLRAFYPDTRPAAAWLRANSSPTADPILVDNGWPYRYELAGTFAGREWWVAEQWWWPRRSATHEGWQLASPELWRDLIRQGTFSYVVFERGGAFNGRGSVFDASVIEVLEQSGRYQLVARFPSPVTWGNSILPPPFRGELRAYDVVPTEVWARVR